MIKIKIPNYNTLELKHVVLDYNGTIAKDGELKKEVKALLPQLCEAYTVHVITADTFGSVKSQMEGFSVVVNVLQTDDHTAEKAAYVKSLKKDTCIAIGNGNNDQEMLKNALLGIAVMGDEGCATATLLQSDISTTCIEDALALLVNEKRLIATLRR